MRLFFFSLTIITSTTIETQGEQNTHTSDGSCEEIIPIDRQKDQAIHPHRATDWIQLRQ